jgi:SAM-dependent methyltransferase
MKPKTGIRSVIEALYFKMIPHPARIRGSLESQRRITNYHMRLDLFFDQLPDGATILDLGSGNRKIAKAHKTVISFDRVDFSRVDIVGDAGELPFKNETFDAITLQSVLEHVEDPWRVVKESFRVLKKGGFVWVEVPFIYPVHDENDYWRWTGKGLDLMCSKLFAKEEAGILMGPGTAMSLINRMSLATLFSFSNRTLYHLLLVPFAWMTFWMKYLDGVTGFCKYDEYAAPLVYFFGRKA